jgi:restriction system protein
MAEITRKRAGEIIRAVFEVLIERGELPPKTLIPLVEQRLPLTEYEAGEYPSSPGSTRFNKIVRFATISPVKAGWMVKGKAGWSVTEEGRAAYLRFTDPGDFMREAVRGYQVWKKTQPDPEDDAADIEHDDIEGASAAVTLERAQEEAWSEIERYLRAMPPYQFQELVASLLRAMSYHVAWVAPPGKDGGVDIVAYTDPLGAQGPRIKVQVKRHNTGRIGVGDLRSFLAVLGSQDIGIFVACNGFSADAQAEARAQDNRRLTLIDLEALFDLWVEHYDAVPELERRVLPLQPVHFLAPMD